MSYYNLGKKLIQLVGGTENIKQLTHCATRLRFEFYNRELVKEDEIKNCAEVISVIEKGGQFQVVIGNEVQSVFRSIREELGETINSNKKKEDKSEKQGIVNHIISVISTTFTPVIPALIGGGMIKAVLSILVLTGLVQSETSTYQILSFISDTPFYFMPVLLAYGAAMKFQCSQILAMTMACAFIHPMWNGFISEGEKLSFFGIPVQLVDYSYSVIPIILSVWIMSYVEKMAEKYSPSIIKFFLKPMLIMFLAIPIGLLAVGPLGNLLNSIVQSGANVLNERVSWLIPMLMGAFQPFLILTGTAWAMTPIATSQISTLGYEIVNGPGMLASNIAQGGATLAVALKTKNRELKQLASSSGFTAVMGITEPCLYGVLLKLKKPFIASMIGGAAGGVYAGISGLVRYAFVSPGLAAIPAFIGENPMNIVHALITIAISFIVGFCAAWILGFEDEKKEEIKEGSKEEKIFSPIKGKVVPLTEVSDDVFAKEVLGKGVAIIPEEGKVYAPEDGEISILFETNHAIGIKTKSGCDLLLHIGIDTVNLQGKYFSPKVKVGDFIKKGDLLLEFDLDKIKEEGYDIITPFIVPDGEYHIEIDEINYGINEQGSSIFQVKRV